ncbi:MAG: NUDIX domain-containing protein [Clostridia bacterium]|nr:NUDIX domain-containing protein [Clostridia bacterium]
MLGEDVSVCVTVPFGTVTPDSDEPHAVNFGVARVQSGRRVYNYSSYIYGVAHPVRVFRGRVVGIVRRPGGQRILIAASKNARPIDIDLRSMLELTKDSGCEIDCLYEHSCGAVVVHGHGARRRYLLIRNRRSTNWSFPKGHVEKGESAHETAGREVFEETGLRVEFLPHFRCTSRYKVGRNVEKLVEVFLGYAENAGVTLQRSEIDDFVWLTYDDALAALKFENDKRILRMAQEELENGEEHSEVHRGT